MSIERDIRELLLEHDLVIVPGFGGLLGHRRAARIDEAHRLIHPPSKDISFNRQLVRNDGLLSDHIASRRGLPHKQAVEIVDRAVAKWKSEIASHGRMELPGIGTFFNDTALNLQFEPDRRANNLKEAYGLRAVAAVPLEATAARPVQPLPRPKEAVVRKLEPVVPEENGTRRAPILWAAAVTTGVLFAASAWLLSNDKLRDRVQLGSFDLFGSSEEAQYVPPTTAVEEFDPVDDGSWAPPPGQTGVQALPIAGARGPLVHVDLGAAPEPGTITDAGSSMDVTTVIAPDKTRVAASTTKPFRYHVIGGCFSVKENADRFLADLLAKGFDAALLDQYHGLYRVAFGSYPDKGTAVEAMSALRKDQGVDLWLLVK